MELLNFLRAAKLKLKRPDSYEGVHVVICNEACDLDSAVSAIVYAYVLHEVSHEHDPDTLFFPVLNIPRDEYSLKTEVVYALSLYDINPDHLVFRDDLDLSTLKQRKKLSLTLVDFNVFPTKDQYLEAAVVEVLDHRKNERLNKSGVDVCVEMVGSCCTLVGERALKDLETIPDDAAWLLYGCILLDTVCLSETAGRTTDKDINMITKLEKRISEVDRKQVFDQLQAAKLDVSALSTIDILRKDLKTVKNDEITIAVSSVPLNIQDFLTRFDLESALDSFASQKRAAVVVIMALYLDQEREPHRQLAVYSANPRLLNQICQELLRADTTLDLSSYPPSPSLPSVCVYRQNNVKSSRKVVLPLIKDWLKTQR